MLPVNEPIKASARLPAAFQELNKSPGVTCLSPSFSCSLSPRSLIIFLTSKDEYIACLLNDSISSSLLVSRHLLITSVYCESATFDRLKGGVTLQDDAAAGDSDPSQNAPEYRFRDGRR